MVLKQSTGETPSDYAVDMEYNDDIYSFGEFLEQKKEKLFDCLTSSEGYDSDDFARAFNKDMKMFGQLGIFSITQNKRLPTPKDYRFEEIEKAETFKNIMNELKGLKAELVVC